MHLKHLSLALAAVALTACGGEGPIVPQNDLTQAEMDVLTEVLFERSFSLAVPEGSSGVESGAALRDIVEFSQTVSSTIDCEAGNIAVTAAISGSIDTDTGLANVDYQTTQDYNGCVVEGEDISYIEINTTPNIVNDYSFQLSQAGSVQFTGSLQGGISWMSAGDRSGSCDISLSFSGSGDQTGASSASMSGTVCGVAIDRSISVTPSG